MKTLYEAVRALLYPGHAAYDAGVAFADGINSYRPCMRDALVRFEHANRGHRHLLGEAELDIAYAGRRTGPYTGQSSKSMRATLRDSLYALADAVRQGYPHPPMAPLDAVLAAVDTLGWLEHYAKDQVYRLCINEKRLGVPRGFALGANVVSGQLLVVHLTVTDTRSGATAQRELPPFTHDRATLGGTAQLLRDAKTALRALLADVSTWPEFSATAQ